MSGFLLAVRGDIRVLAPTTCPVLEGPIPAHEHEAWGLPGEPTGLEYALCLTPDGTEVFLAARNTWPGGAWVVSSFNPHEARIERALTRLAGWAA